MNKGAISTQYIPIIAVINFNKSLLRNSLRSESLGHSATRMTNVILNFILDFIPDMKLRFRCGESSLLNSGKVSKYYDQDCRLNEQLHETLPYLAICLTWVEFDKKRYLSMRSI